jgi:hypothetical protein
LHYLQASVLTTIAILFVWVLPQVGFVRAILGRLPRARDWLERKVYET